MRSIQDTCRPRPDILTGSFNPEIFTASLSAVLDAHRGRGGGTLYADPEVFFREATYPTEGMRMVVGDVMARLAGDAAAPAIHRLETAFGGGKTHTLIALAHLGHDGAALAGLVEPLFGRLPLPEAGAVDVVGVAGDELPVHKPQGTALVPYTLWGEIAFQIGGEALYRAVETDATSFAAPGKDYFARVLGGRRAIIMLDELAQYATRLEGARANGAEQLAAFLMALHGYAREHAGIAVVLTLASRTDAFARQGRHLVELLTEVKGQEVDEAAAVALATRAGEGARSVVARDATTIVPVQAAEIAGVLAKRLFVAIDAAAAEDAAQAYAELYAKSAAMLPEEASRPDFRERMRRLYPFHPTFVDFLNQKLATVETFQGTRGVLRVLALAVRALWRRQQATVPMMHACHLDLRDSRTVNEIVGRTGTAGLLPVLNADVGGPDTAALAGACSRAELADRKNPHPAGLPLHEYVWKTVFLHSLVGRGSEHFGLTLAEALLAAAFPGLTPAQAETALSEIRNSALYLRFQNGRYFASVDPSINIALEGIRSSLRGTPAAQEHLAAAARKLVDAKHGMFEVAADVAAPEHVADGKGRPTLAIVALDAGTIDMAAMLATTGPNRPRINQNNLFLLVPETVHVQGEFWNEERVQRAQALRNELGDLALDALARQKLLAKPQDYGITPKQLHEAEFEKDAKERVLAVQTRVGQAYATLWFSGAGGQPVGAPIRTAGGEGGAPILQQIREVLEREGKLITEARAATQETVIGLGKLFFALGQTPTLGQLRDAFVQRRDWPVLERAELLDQIVRKGVERGHWCLFRMGGAERTEPAEIYHRDGGEVPLTADLAKPDWALVSVPGAKQRGWIKEARLDPEKVERWIAEALQERPAAKVEDVLAAVRAEHGELPKAAVLKAMDELIRKSKLAAYSGEPDQEAPPPTLVHGAGALMYAVKPDDVLIVPAEVVRRGWSKAPDKTLHLSGAEAARTLLPLLNRIGSLYGRGAKSTVNFLQLVDLQVDGALLKIEVENASPAAMRQLAELFEVVHGVARMGNRTEAEIEIKEPADDCPLVQALGGRR